MSIFRPIQDERYADTGRRLINIFGVPVKAACSKLKPEEAARYGATHAVTCQYIGAAKAGLTIDFDGDLYQVVRVLDPYAADPAMRRKFLRLICTVA